MRKNWRIVLFFAIFLASLVAYSRFLYARDVCSVAGAEGRRIYTQTRCIAANFWLQEDGN